MGNPVDRPPLRLPQTLYLAPDRHYISLEQRGKWSLPKAHNRLWKTKSPQEGALLGEEDRGVAGQAITGG